MMNKGQDKINIEIKIAGERIMLSVPFDSQEDVRDSYYRDLLKIHKQAVAMADECNSEARRMLSL